MASLMSGLDPGTVGQDTMNLTEKNDAEISHFLNKSRNFFLFFSIHCLHDNFQPRQKVVE